MNSDAGMFEGGSVGIKTGARGLHTGRPGLYPAPYHSPLRGNNYIPYVRRIL